jgi:hypothetical protein
MSNKKSMELWVDAYTDALINDCKKVCRNTITNLIERNAMSIANLDEIDFALDKLKEKLKDSK